MLCMRVQVSEQGSGNINANVSTVAASRRVYCYGDLTISHLKQLC